MNYTITVEIRDGAGNKVWSMEAPAEWRDVCEPRMATPGVKPVADYLTSLSRSLEPVGK